MAETTHVDLRRSRTIALAAALTVCGTMLLVAVPTWLFNGSRIDVFALALERPRPVDYLLHLMQFPLPYIARFSLPRTLWILLGFAIVGVVLYALLTGSRRAVPARGAGFAVFLLGWACTALAVGAAAIVFDVAGGPYWPAVDLSRAAGSLLNGAEWGLLFGWLGGLAAALAYSRTASPASPIAMPGSLPGFPASGMAPPSPRRASARKAWTVAASAAVSLGLLVLVGGLLALRDRPAIDIGYQRLLMFPKPVSGLWYFAGDPPDFTMALDLFTLFLLAVTAVMAMTLLLGSAVRLVRPSKGAGGVFLLGWGCAILVAGGIGLLRALVFLIAHLATGGRYEVGFSPYEVLAEGAVYGLLLGWLVGGVAVVAYLRGRAEGR
ncbi:hypothetical protein [Nonomuraea sp. NPDC048916]|uniref:hypothetical protein n=1 Tax=Nonomuraea sp. NPDC048916 TaxID=3154232 RepID=UPI0033F9B23B